MPAHPWPFIAFANDPVFGWEPTAAAPHPAAQAPTIRAQASHPKLCPTCLLELDETGFCNCCGLTVKL